MSMDALGFKKFEITKVTETDVYFREVREDGVSEGGVSRDKLAEQAYMWARGFGDKRVLNEAIKHGLTEILDEQYRDMLQEIINGAPPRVKHPKEYWRREDKELGIWRWLHYWKGTGLPLKSEVARDDGRGDACSKAAEMFHVSYDQIWKIYRSLKKINDDKVSKGMVSELEFAKRENLSFGRVSFICKQVFHYQDQGWLENGAKITLDDVIKSAATQLGIDSGAALKLYEAYKKEAKKGDKSRIGDPLKQLLQARGYELP